MIAFTRELLTKLQELDAGDQPITCIVDPFWSETPTHHGPFTVLDVVPSDQGTLLVLGNGEPEQLLPLPQRDEEERLAFDEQLADEMAHCPQCMAPL
jgi:hypothetical protein